MKIHKVFLVSVVALSLVLSACAPAAAGEEPMNEPTEAMMEEPTEEMMEATAAGEMMEPTAHPGDSMSETPAPDAMAEPDEGAMMETPAWFSSSLTNVSTAESFAINDFKGKVVLVEMMAQWCSTCKRQQNEVKGLHENLGLTDDLVTVVLDIDPNEDAATLKDYAANNGFPWLYAVSPVEVSREIGNLYGDQFLNPPSAPMLIVDRKGVVHPLPFGVKSADDLMKALQPYLDEM